MIFGGEFGGVHKRAQSIQRITANQQIVSGGDGDFADPTDLIEQSNLTHAQIIEATSHGHRLLRHEHQNAGITYEDRRSLVTPVPLV